MIVDDLITALSTFGIPVYRQGALSEMSYPDSFFTFWLTESYDHSHYDNNTYLYSYQFDVNLYSTDPNYLYQTMSDARDTLKNNGFIVSGKGSDIESDSVDHIGMTFRVYALED